MDFNTILYIALGVLVLALVVMRAHNWNEKKLDDKRKKVVLDVLLDLDQAHISEICKETAEDLKITELVDALDQLVEDGLVREFRPFENRRLKGQIRIAVTRIRQSGQHRLAEMVACGSTFMLCQEQQDTHQLIS